MSSDQTNKPGKELGANLVPKSKVPSYFGASRFYESSRHW